MVNFIKTYFSQLFLMYYGRWMLSAIVMLPFMLLFEYLNIGLALNLFLGQTVGTLIFFGIDKYIFNNFSKPKIKG